MDEAARLPSLEAQTPGLDPQWARQSLQDAAITAAEKAGQVFTRHT